LNILDYGAIGDGTTLNLNAFENAIKDIETKFPNSTLYIPKGTFLTIPFNLTSHMTLFIDNGAVLKGTKK
jgi:polygalacturonase